MRIFNVSDYAEYLKDESGYCGHAEKLYLADGEDEICRLLSQGGTYTIQGARTGISGACVPVGGDIIDMSGLSGFTGMRTDGEFYYIELYAGTTGEELSRALERREFNIQSWSVTSVQTYEMFKLDKPYFFAPMPTEKTATLGGMFSTDAAGPQALYYGSVSDYVTGLTIVDGRGEKIEIKNPEDIRVLAGTEGMCAIVTRLEIKLIPKLPVQWSIAAFFDSCSQAYKASEWLLNTHRVRVIAVDLMDTGALELYSVYAQNHPKLKNVPQIPKSRYLLYLQAEAEAEELMEVWLEALLEQLIGLGAVEEDLWAADNYEELERFACLRHGITEALIHPGESDTVLLDFNIGKYNSEQFMALIRELLPEKDVLGTIVHTGQQVVHLCVRRKTEELGRLIDTVLKNGGGLGTENGVGKVKKEYLLCSDFVGFPKDFQQLKQCYDPGNRFNRENGL